MAKVTMKLEGVEHLQRAIKECPEILAEHVYDSVQRSTFSDYQRMRARVPVRTGTLRNALTLTRTFQNKKTGLTSARVVIGPEGWYWHFVEYGTIHMAARPFIRPSNEAEAPEYLNRIRGFIPKIERAWSSGGAGLL
jgi:HK97 gp10 family phage protein